MDATAVIAAHAGGVEMVSAAAAHVKEMGAFVPFASCPPVPAAFVTIISVLAGGSETAAYWIAALLSWIAGAWAATRTGRRSGTAGPTPWLAGATVLFAPSRLWMLLIAPDLPRLLFWTAAAFLAGALLRTQKPNAARIAWAAIFAAIAAGSHPLAVNAVDFIAGIELAVLAIVCNRAVSALCGVAPTACLASIVAAFWHYSVLTYYRFDPGPPPRELRSWFAANAANRRMFENQASLGLIAQPGLSVAVGTIQSPGSGGESLLWLRALAAEYLVTADWPKFHSQLDPVFESGSWVVYRLPAPNPADAVLVSFPVWRQLPEIRGIRDEEALSAYLEWSGRPEQVEIVWQGHAAATIKSNLGEFDAILVRRAAIPGWRTWLVDADGNETSFPVGSDPLGYLVLAPRVEGPVTIQLRFQPGVTERLWPSAPVSQQLSIGAFPVISPNGIVDAAKYTPGPFAPSAVISVYGRGFVDGSTRVLVGSQPVTPLYTGSNQINFRLPESLSDGTVEVIVEVAGALSRPAEIEVVAR